MDLWLAFRKQGLMQEWGGVNRALQTGFGPGARSARKEMIFSFVYGICSLAVFDSELSEPL